MAVKDGRQTADVRRRAIDQRRIPINVRRLSFIIGLTIVGALLGWGVGRLVEQRTLPRGVVYGVPPQIDLATHDVGATVDLTALDQTARERLTGGAPCLHIRWLRQPIHWRDIEKSPGQFTWPQLNLPLVDAFGRRIHILVVLQDSPDWARDTNQPVSAPPKDARPFGAFARAFTEQFKGQIDAYQIWDEPNIAAGWGGKYANANEYATLLREGAINIRAADPNAKIISAALAPNTESGPLNLNEPEYLRAMYRAGAKDFFDAVGAEPFGFWTGPDDRRVDVSVLNFSRVILLREVMEANGDAHKAIWATSFGWSIAGLGDPAYGGDEQNTQLMRTGIAIHRAQDEWAWLGTLMFARWQPIGANDPRAGFALQDEEGRARLLLGVGMGCGNFRVAPIGRYPADDWSAVYPPNWRVAPDGADIPQNDSTPLTIGFRGTRFDLRVRRGNYEAFLFVKVDGQPANALPRDEQARAYVVLFDPLAQTDDVTLARDLPNKEHFVEIVPRGGWGQWAITGWTVSNEREEDGRVRLLGALIGAAVGGVFALVLRRTTDDGRSTNALSSLVIRHSSLVAHHSSFITRIAFTLTFVAGVALYLSPSVTLSWPIIALLAVLVVWRLDAGLALVALASPFYLQPKSLGIGSYSVVEIVLLLCMVSFGVRWILCKRERPSPPTPLPFRERGAQSPSPFQGEGRRAGWSHFFKQLSALDYVVALWLMAGALGVVVAENFGVANREFRVVFAEPALYYLLIRTTRMDARILVNVFLLGATMVAGKGLFDWVTHRDLITAEGVLRVRSVYFSPNNLALFLDRAAPLALCLALFGTRWRMLYFVAFALMLGALYLTFAKGAWLLALPAAFILIGVLRGRRLFVASLAVLAVLGASLLPVLGTERVRSLFDLTSGTSFIRVQLWQSTLAMIRDHPIFGVGLDNFLYQYRTRYVLPTAFAEANLSHPHDILLDFWTRLGLLGVLLLVALLVVFWRESLRRYRALPDGDARALTLGLMASMAAALAHGLIDNSFFLVDLAFVLMLTLAILRAES